MADLQPATAPVHPYPVTGSLVIECPENWFYKESLTLLDPDGGSNIIVSTEPLSPELTTEQYAAIQGDLLRKEFSGFEEHSFGPAAILGISANVAIRDFSWSPPEGSPRVRQLQLYAVLQRRGITLTCTAPEENFPRYESILRATMETLEVDERRLGPPE
jgi:hypothetical protein